ncbi:MAG: helix-turn-helix transcriptional regulator [Marinifilaceae bacterium]|nr:helix-turn-helix transcriptional regulator [Marinifilaceae bacterium]
MNTNDLFKNELEKVDNDVKIEIDLSFQIADKISSILKSKGMTQKEFAEKMQKSEAEISRWVGGTHNFTIRTIAKISDVLGEQIIQVTG